MYGKAFERMYDGSMLGAGLNVFAVWNWIIAKSWQPTLEINPVLLAFTLGGKDQDVGEIVAALEFLERPDPGSRSKLEEGRRIVKEGQFQYRVVNWEEYQKIRNEADLREYNCRKQREYRASKKAELSGLTPEQRLDYEAHREIEYNRRRKVGKRALKHEAQVSGAREAIADGLEEASKA